MREVRASERERERGARPRTKREERREGGFMRTQGALGALRPIVVVRNDSTQGEKHKGWTGDMRNFRVAPGT